VENERAKAKDVGKLLIGGSIFRCHEVHVSCPENEAETIGERSEAGGGRGREATGQTHIDPLMDDENYNGYR
jgi:hypothetical protein